MEEAGQNLVQKKIHQRSQKGKGIEASWEDNDSKWRKTHLQKRVVLRPVLPSAENLLWRFSIHLTQVKKSRKNKISTVSCTLQLRYCWRSSQQQCPKKCTKWIRTGYASNLGNRQLLCNCTEVLYSWCAKKPWDQEHLYSGTSYCRIILQNILYFAVGRCYDHLNFLGRSKDIMHTEFAGILWFAVVLFISSHMQLKVKCLSYRLSVALEQV